MNWIKVSICIFLVATSAIFSAIMDVGNFKPHKLRKRPWWIHDWRRKYINGNPAEGRVVWFWKIKRPVQIIDGWHFSKMMMIILLSTAILVNFNLNWWQLIVGYFAAYVVWNGTSYNLI